MNKLLFIRHEKQKTTLLFKQGTKQTNTQKKQKYSVKLIKER